MRPQPGTRPILGKNEAQSLFVYCFIAMEALLALPTEGMDAVELGLQVNHRAAPVKPPEQGLELTDPEVPLILHRGVAGAEMDHLGLEQARPGLLAAGEHLAAKEGPGLATGQAVQYPVIVVAAQPQLPVVRGRPVADAAIDDGFGLHAGTPGKRWQPSNTGAPREKGTASKSQRRPWPSRQAITHITSASPVITMKGT